MKYLYIAAALATLAAPALASSEHTVLQQSKAFNKKELSIKVGDKLVFKNEDPFVHNIFSLSKPKPFDLGTFGKGQARDIVFAQEGTYEIECAIHPEMTLTVKVAK